MTNSSKGKAYPKNKDLIPPKQLTILFVTKLIEKVELNGQYHLIWK